MSIRVLLVDDERDFIDALAERLASRGFLTEVVYDGTSAIAKAGERSYDAIILDLAMPGIDGLETLQRLLAVNPDLQVVLLTGEATVEAGVEAMKRGAVDLLQKPAPLADLIHRIDEAARARMLLVERRTEEQVAEILRTKGW